MPILAYIQDSYIQDPIKVLEIKFVIEISVFYFFQGEFERSIHRALLYNSVPNNATMRPLIFSENQLNVPTVTPSLFKVVCYYSFPGASDALQPDELDPYMCTHINAAFASVTNNTVNVEADNLKVLKELVRLKKINHRLKILICAGGASNDGGFSEMVMNHTNRKRYNTIFLCK